MWLTSSEVLETLRMIQSEHLDIRTVTLGVSLWDCADANLATLAEKIREKLCRKADRLSWIVDEVAAEFGIPIIHRRLSVTPISLVAAGTKASCYHPIAQALDRAAREVGANYVGGFSALVQKGFTDSDRTLLASLPKALTETERVCGSVAVASTRTGINMDAVARMGPLIRSIAEKSPNGIAASKLVIFANAVEDNPFMAGAFHGPGEAESAINVGISGPGVILSMLKRLSGADLGRVSDEIKRTAFKITRTGELVGREVSKRLGTDFGIVDISLAPTPAEGDSIAEVLEAMGLERCGTHGTTAALALLNDAVKKGGAMASSYVGGLSGAFIPVSEDSGMVRAAEEGALSLDKLEAMTSVCSVGLDMVAVPGDTPPETISAIIADEMAIGVINNKTVGVRILPIPGARPGDRIDFGGLLGTAYVMPVNRFSSLEFIRRGGRIPAPLQGLTN
ncbi:MAG: PFL family protein [Armatimonadetes bacterium]|nr:PFL family protein [Armatimonadota bacterium]